MRHERFEKFKTLAFRRLIARESSQPYFYIWQLPCIFALKK
nr:MAG TPA: hypothetical protein [Caudoviricetes sp.]